MPVSNRRIRALLAIVERGQGSALIGRLGRHGLGYQFRFAGQGTASSEMLDILGLGSTEKDIVFSLGTEDAAADAVRSFTDSLGTAAYRGIMMLLSPSAISRLSAAVLNMQLPDNSERKDSVNMKNEHRHSLIFIVVNQGYTDQVMQTARRAGATGGTVIRARLADAEQLSQFHGIALQEEREIVAILAPDSIRDQLMNDVNAAWGTSSEAQGVLCAVPVDRAFKI